MLHIDRSSMLSCPGHAERNEMTTMGELAHYHKYTVVPISGDRQISDPIKRYIKPFCLRHGISYVCLTIRLVSPRFLALTNGALPNVLDGCRCHSWPIIPATQKMKHAIFAYMTRNSG